MKSTIHPRPIIDSGLPSGIISPILFNSIALYIILHASLIGYALYSQKFEVQGCRPTGWWYNEIVGRQWYSDTLAF